MSVVTDQRLFLSPPHMGKREEVLVAEAFRSNYLAPVGPMLQEFERTFSEHTGVPHCVALSSGTAAVHLAVRHVLEGAGFRFQVSGGRTDPRPHIITSTLTFIGSVTPATFEGCDVTFIDCDRDSWNMDPDLLASELKECAANERLPAAVIPTDIYGQCCDLPRIREICDAYGIPVICDSAEAMGAKYRNAECGVRNEEEVESSDSRSEFSSLNTEQRTLNTDPTPWLHAGYGATAAVYSFNGNKIITTSGGGMLASHDEQLIAHARELATQARDPAPHYEHSEIGYNYRMSNILAAIGVGQLEVLDERVQRKREIFSSYRELLGDLPGISFMPEAEYNRSTRWLTVILVSEEEFGVGPADIRAALEAENIEARPVWKPMHMQPVFRCDAGSKVQDTGGAPVYRVRGGEVAENLFARGLCLPSGTAMSGTDIERVASIVRKCRP